MKKEEEITLTDRMLSAIILSTLVSITIAVLPIALAFLKLGKAGFFAYAFYKQWWFIVVAAASAITGFISGPDKSFSLLGHLWFTEIPKNHTVSVSLWAGILFILLISYI